MTRDELDALPYGVITLDRHGRILRFNYAEATFARRTVQGTLGLAFFTDVAPCTNVQGFKGRFDAFARNRDSGVDRFDFTFAFRWGSQDVSITLLRKAEREEINLIVRGRTIELLDIASSAPTANPRLSGVALLAEPDSGSRLFSIGTQERACATAWHMGSTQEQAWRAEIHPDDVASRDRIVVAAAARRTPYVVEYRMHAGDDVPRIVVEHGSFAAGKGAPGYATIVDITQRRRRETQLWQLAHYDSVTGLPNSALLLERIATAAAEACSNGHLAAIVALTFSRLTEINADFGRVTGDNLLRLVALRLGESVRGGDTVARLHDEAFVVLLTEVESADSVAATVGRIVASVSQPFALEGHAHRLAASVGISIAPRNGTDPAALLQAAESAAFASQRGGRHAVEWFSSAMSADMEAGHRVQNELRLALERDELVLHYQPIVDVNAGAVAVEALVRWNHPSRGLVMPGEFIAIAERAGLIVTLGEWVLRAACRQARAWIDAGLDLHVCVNVSTIQFRERNFVESIVAVLAESALPAGALELELTESVMVDGFQDVIQTLTDLKVVGVRLAIDDFGTGYSSLSYLKYFPIDTLKLDRAFVADIATDTFDRAIAKAVLTLAAELKVDCVAEGVETAEQFELLRELGCRRFQGYYFAKPQMAAALASGYLLEKRSIDAQFPSDLAQTKAAGRDGARSSVRASTQRPL